MVTDDAAYFESVEGGDEASGFETEPARLNADGTVDILADLTPTGGSSRTGNFVEFEDDVYFSHSVTGGDSGLYRIETDGSTPEASEWVSDSGVSGSGGLVAFGDHLYFTRDTATSGREPWRGDVDGDIERVADINPGAADSNPDYYGAIESDGAPSADDALIA